MHIIHCTVVELHQLRSQGEKIDHRSPHPNFRFAMEIFTLL